MFRRIRSLDPRVLMCTNPKQERNNNNNNNNKTMNKRERERERFWAKAF
jgi:hypothetical protein